MSETKKEGAGKDKAAGGCKECSCPSWRSDSGSPEKCINIRPPTKKLCGHSKADHN